MGRPPTSGYCDTCRKRRIKCDRTRPSCQRCFKAGYVCEGYNQPLRIQNHVIGTDAGGSQRLVRATGSTSTLKQGPPSELSLIAFQEQMAFSHFFSTYRWAHFWRPIMKTAEPDGGAAVDYTWAVERSLGLAHNQGVAQILQHCGPEWFQNEPFLTIFRSCRALLICQGFASKQSSFLAEGRWKTVPWSHAPKTSEDQLVDILAELPDITRHFAIPGHVLGPKDRADLIVKSDNLSAQLARWRSKWENTHQGMAIEVPQGLDTSGILEPVQELLSTSIAFRGLGPALEIFNYNASLIYLMRLRLLMPDTFDHLRSLPPVDMDYVKQTAGKQRQSPLLLPDETKFLLQPAIEAFRILPYLQESLTKTNVKVMGTLESMGILYNSVMDMPELASLLPLLDRITFFQDGQRELAAFNLPAWVIGRDHPFSQE
ncbi:uncharacterized protein BCR38DRAFT_473486 [Pseudomassariella vexata]|uniref:Zn(2)-C6 fungal-type domain-containing protein n=1 Tax=Pseudomassariella vexata TaxID=1141098 RepID=A0A1Y2E3V1_9PEZI|nr:uncharacterized protein BCR38DRAFT_473486 [Pseudomassariella vexata]ORY66202.1 hypothetical protein BCR38DRAFT_473486 [Pseudomassariella vexata]